MKEIIRIAVFACVAALQLQGADADHDVLTKGHFNGWAWIAMRKAKATPFDAGEMYLAGAISALDSVGENEAVNATRPHMSPAELSLALDNFFLNSLNRPIPIVFAFIAVKLRVEGADEDTQERASAILRKDASAAPAKP